MNALKFVYVEIIPFMCISAEWGKKKKKLYLLGKTSKFITAGCRQNAAAFKSNVQHFLYKLAAAGC